MTNAEQQYDIAERDAVTADLEREGREELAAELTKERFGPLPKREPGHEGARVRFIATMHAIIAWFVAHPDVPAPWAVSIGIKVPSAEDIARLAVLLETMPHPQVGRPDTLHLFDEIDSPIYTPIAISVADAFDERPL